MTETHTVTVTFRDAAGATSRAFAEMAESLATMSLAAMPLSEAVRQVYGADGTITGERLIWQMQRDALIERNRAHTRDLRARNADRRAKKLLAMFLTRSQMTDWEQLHTFLVKTRDGKRVYQINDRANYNVTLVKMHKAPPDPIRYEVVEGMRLCAVLTPVSENGRWHHAPRNDHVLTLAMLIAGGPESERHFLQIANPEYPDGVLRRGIRLAAIAPAEGYERRGPVVGYLRRVRGLRP